MTRFIPIMIFVLLSCEGFVPTVSDANQSQNQGVSILPRHQTPKNDAEPLEDGEKDLAVKVIGVKDGDTVEVLYHELTIDVRLEHIDAPEKRRKQPFGSAAKKVLSDLCFGKNLFIRTDGEFDRNGRLIGELIDADGININREMVWRGYAWHYQKYSDDDTYAEAEAYARKNKLGLWADENPIAPWDFRKKKK